MSIRTRIDTAIGRNKQTLLTTYIIEKLREAVDDEDVGIEGRSRFDQLGIDSKRALEMKEDMESELNCRFRSTLLFDYPTPEALSHYIVEHVLAGAGAVPVPVPESQAVAQAGREGDDVPDIDKELDAILSEFDV